ncbi:MAG TPA: carboxypeptidase-like regulatory domain-containing protein [Bryobacteraceae bacterium]|nr:carboxypeptidase-like regulatory domain-containing protein [Bryobacteraceae bacterium]
MQRGNYQFVNLLPGTYGISVDQPGFKRFRRSLITVEVQSAVRIDVALQVGKSSQSIEVTKQTPLLQTHPATMGQAVDSK